MNQIGREWSEVSALYLKNCYTGLCLHSIICKYRPVSSKLEQNIYVQQNFKESDHGPFGSKQLELFALELGKIATFNCVYSLDSTNTWSQ